ncbi:hypothetical protein [Sinisalibacter lacisalsi]|uniref:DUF2946 domain-containing protein n=1 Tax=Sinisalibacter lacisalsi TaxID=1526570 RepID=A0ABQ1QRF3_9RHOB|nr:hypothetical protein [Sinisalibacter lacisalsi]GGD38609.1 hypothetical protein GCM10011358_23080 [Sinisalibacter lacisalsi]
MQARGLISLHAIAGPIARVAALFAMLVQFAFYADHIGAMAAKATGSGAPDARFGFLEICTGNGIEVIAIGDGPVDPAHACPICENASVMAFGEPPAMALPGFALVPLDMAWEFAPGADTAALRFPGNRPIRAPPAMRS